MKTLAATVMTIVLMSANAPQLCAGVQVGDIITLANGVGHPGGIFNVDDLTNALVPNFDTFCAELEENVFFNTQYRVIGIGTVSVTGGKSLTPFAAWLYDRFLGHGGGLAAFNPVNPFDVNTLQFAIWKSLGYTASQIDTDVGPGTYSTYNLSLTFKPWQAAFNNDVANSVWSGLGSVRIMNLKTLAGLNGQDQLVEVPEPISAVVWPLILACLGASWTVHARRRG